MSGGQEVFTPPKSNRNMKLSAMAIRNVLSNARISQNRNSAEDDSGSDGGDQVFVKHAFLLDNEILPEHKLFTFRRKFEPIINQPSMEPGGTAKTPHALRVPMERSISEFSICSMTKR